MNKSSTFPIYKGVVNIDSIYITSVVLVLKRVTFLSLILSNHSIEYHKKFVNLQSYIYYKSSFEEINEWFIYSKNNIRVVH